MMKKAGILVIGSVTSGIVIYFIQLDDVRRVVEPFVADPWTKIFGNSVALCFFVFLARRGSREIAPLAKERGSLHSILFGSLWGLCSGITLAIFMSGCARGVIQLLE